MLRLKLTCVTLGLCLANSSAREEPTFKVVPKTDDSVDGDDFYSSGKPQAPYFTRHPTTTTIKEGHPVRFECTLQPIGDPNMTVEWYCNKQLVKVGKSTKGIA